MIKTCLFHGCAPSHCKCTAASAAQDMAEKARQVSCLYHLPTHPVGPWRITERFVREGRCVTVTVIETVRI